MAPVSPYLVRRDDPGGRGDWRQFASDEDFIIEGWSEGFMVGALVIMACVTVANMRHGVLLHKLILVEQLAALSHGTFCFMAFRGYGWYLSSTATLLYCSWIVHNVVAWMKVRPFFCDTTSIVKPETGKWVRRIYLGTLALTVPFIFWQIANNFRFFNNIDDFYVRVRPYEPLLRDPWWVFSCLTLFYVINTVYGTGVFELIKRSPRFGILLAAISLALIFTAVDIAASIHNFIGSTDGINPWWKLSLVFKCLTDTIMLDDFKTELKRLGVKRMREDELRRRSFALVADPSVSKEDDDHMEFTDALDVNPARFQTMQNLNNNNPPTSTPMDRLRQESMTNMQNDSKESVGKAGKKISRLPALKDFAFSSSVQKKKKDQIEDPEKEGGAEQAGDDDDVDAAAAPPPPPAPAPDRRADMRRSLGVIDYHSR